MHYVSLDIVDVHCLVHNSRYNKLNPFSQVVLMHASLNTRCNEGLTVLFWVKQTEGSKEMD